MAHRAPADVGLGDLRNAQRRLHAGVGAHLLQRVPRELEQDPFEDRGHRGQSLSRGRSYWPMAKRAKRRMTMFSPVVAVSSSRSCCTVLPSNFGLCISCSASTTVSYQESSLPA